MPYPNFLGIGAMKAGTSWLDANLRKHPQIWMPPLKEIRYFEKGCHASRRIARHPEEPEAERRASRRVIDDAPQHDASRRNARRLTKLIQPSFRKLMFTHPIWMSQYLFGKQTDKWYSSLFRPAEDQICGEISPDYAKLDEETVKHIHELMPDLKIIFFLRNPIDRAWSHILWDFCGGDGRHNLESIDLESCIKHAESNSSLIRGKYMKTIETWQKFYPENQIFIGFFDEIKEEPEELLRKVEGFLGVREFVPESVAKKVNVTPGPKMPEGLREYLTKMYQAEISELAEKCGGYAEKWLRTDL